ncbi:MAG: 2Fe-2S iron-sulfur cluster-binding protein, partial [Gammaproteobacteria bacterium]|nr:2Fe-2S iron-sulfur cluster-binding protein [Gammaproteobacteria bacterium]
ILVDGELRYSCTMSTKDVDGARLTTVEGLAEGHAGDGPLSAVQAVLLDHNASQCGYCLSGIAIAAHALFERNPAPSREEIVAALDDQLCRCGAHPRVVTALLELGGRG